MDVVWDPERAATAERDRLALMRRVAVAMFLAGGVTCGLGVIFTQSTRFSRAAQSGCAGRW